MAFSMASGGVHRPGVDENAPFAAGGHYRGGQAAQLRMDSVGVTAFHEGEGFLHGIMLAIEQAEARVGMRSFSRRPQSCQKVEMMVRSTQPNLAILA